MKLQTHIQLANFSKCTAPTARRHAGKVEISSCGSAGFTLQYTHNCCTVQLLEATDMVEVGSLSQQAQSQCTLALAAKCVNGIHCSLLHHPCQSTRSIELCWPA
jgi:hypothetical protein